MAWFHFWSFLLGLFIGGCIGFFALALCVCSGRADEDMERMMRDKMTEKAMEGK